MIEINAENLKIAYKKLKSYVYYYNSSNFLKKKIIEFESWNSKEGMDLKFNTLAKTLMSEIEYLKNYHDSLFKVEPPRNYYHPSYLVYPKKNTASNDGESVKVDGINLFIDLDIKYHLVDVLYALNLEEKFHTNIDESAYGNVVNKHAIEYSNQGFKMLDNTLLFENHTFQYKKWKNCLLEAFRKEDSNNEYEDSLENVAIIKFDVEKCFYNIRFNFDDYDLGDGISAIMKNIFNYYKTIVIEKMGLPSLSTNVSLLPIGLVSSYVILNSIMYNVDKKLTETTLGHGRYVDDFLILVSVNDFKQDKEKFLCEYFSDLLKSVNTNDSSNTDLKLIVNDSLELKLNKEKTIVKYYKKLKRNDIQDETYDLVSNSIDIDEIEDRKSNITIDEKTMQKIGYEFNKIYNWADLKRYFFELDEQELINSFPLWKMLFCKIKELSEDSEEMNSFIAEIVKRITDSIDKITIKLEKINTNFIDDFRKNLINVLKNELDVAKGIVFDSIFTNHYLSTISQNDKINFIEDKNQFIYAFPIRITQNEIMFYLETHNFLFCDEDSTKGFFNLVDFTYKNLNDYHIYGFDSFSTSLETDEKYKKIYVKISFEGNLLKVFSDEKLPNSKEAFVVKKVKKIDISKKLKIALVNFALPEVSLEKEQKKKNKEDISHIYDMENYDIFNQSSKEANLNVIKRIIRKAKNNGADYIVFPEFAIQYDDGMDVLNYCRKMHVSLISGLTHKLDKKTKSAYNLTMIYDDRLSLCLCHYKRYLAPLEKELLLNNDYIGVSVLEYPYFIIDDELLKYSSMTCYEGTNIHDRALFQNQIEAMFLPVYNFDTPYFSNIVESFSRDISAYIIQSNANCYGDSRITAPIDIKNMDIVKLKGGINSYFVIGEIDRSMRILRGEHEKRLDDIYDDVAKKGFVEEIDKEKLNNEKNDFKNKNKYNSNVFKSFSAGTNK